MKRLMLLITLAATSAAQGDVGPTTRPATRPTTRSATLGHPPKPTSHTIKDVEGWMVQVDDRLLSGPDKRLGDRALLLLGHQLANVAMHVPPDKVARLRQVKIQLDMTHGLITSAQYHPSRGWLRSNGYSETLEKVVHIPHAGRFASARLQRDQPWMVLHELAHAYHDQVLGFREARIKAAWQRFVESGKYKLIRHINGSSTAHYALTNEKEFFAEMCESYFGFNDFFPFNSDELKSAEPEVYQLLEQIWGPTR